MKRTLIIEIFNKIEFTFQKPIKNKDPNDIENWKDCKYSQDLTLYKIRKVIISKIKDYLENNLLEYCTEDFLNEFLIDGESADWFEEEIVKNNEIFINKKKINLFGLNKEKVKKK